MLQSTTVTQNNGTICNVFKLRLIAHCAFFFTALLDSFFPNTARDMDDAFCPSPNFICVRIEFKYSFTFRHVKRYFQEQQ